MTGSASPDVAPPAPVPGLGGGRRVRTRRGGVALSAGAAVAYGTGPVLIKAALLGGIAVWMMMVSRMLIAAVLLWGLVVVSRALRGVAPGTRRYVAAALTLGALVYSAQLACFALAIERISASLVVILFHTFPIMVTVVAVVVGRDRFSATRLAALALGVGGVALVAVAGGELRAEPVGIVLALCSAVACAGVVLGSDVLSDHLPPLPLAALLISGAAIAFGVTLPFMDAGGSVDAPTWLLVVAIAVIPGVLGTTAMLAGVGAIGPSLASILMTLEPPVAVALAWLVFSETLNAAQILGAGVILVAAYLARRVARPLDRDIEVRS